MKKLVYLLLLIPFYSFGQQPLINSIAPTHIEVGESVTISGSNLGGRVFFGGVEATSVTGSGNVIEAVVPAGVIQGPITVLNNNLVAQSSQHFYISYVGSTLTTYDNEALFPAGSGASDANDICLCDLDADGLNDIIMTHNSSLTDNSKIEISIYENLSIPTATNFSLVTEFDSGNSDNDRNNPINTTGFPIVSCNDLDNDGKPELIFTTNNGGNSRHIYIYRNTSTGDGDISLTDLGLNLLLPDAASGNRITRGIDVADMDGDGKQDLIVGNQTDDTIHIFLNNSNAPGNFGFAEAYELNAGGEETGVIIVSDLNNDGLSDVISSPFRVSSSQIHIFKNTSITGSLNFVEQASVTNGGQVNDITSGDIDNDGLNDIIVASRQTGIITVFRNSTTGASLTFDMGVNPSLTGSSPFGIDLGDIDGDGDVDIVSSFAAGDVYVIPNNSTSGVINFGSDQELSTGRPTGFVGVRCLYKS
jgi:hypothetical protein